MRPRNLKISLNSLTSPLGFASLISVVFAASTAAAAVVALSLYSTELTDRLWFETEHLAHSLASIEHSAGSDVLQEQLALQNLSEQEQISLAAYFDKNRGYLTGSSGFSEPFTGRKLLAINPEITGLQPEDEGSDGLFFGFGIETETGWILVARDSRWVTDSQEVLEQSIEWGLGIAMIIVALVAFYMARHTQLRVHNINRTLEDAAAGNLDARCEVHQVDKDDLSQVAKRINQTLNHLQDSMESLQQVSADIAHDLRRPLTRLRLKLEHSLALANDPDAMEANLVGSLDELDGVSRTFDAILRLAQIQSGAHTVRSEPIELNDLCRDLYELYQPVAEDYVRQLRLVTVAERTVILGDLDLLRQVIVNLIDNALRYTPEGSIITLEVISEANRLGLSVCDNGPGIPEAEFERVKRRFYRLDTSRNIEGTGLGLSLVSAIAERHGARFQLHDNCPGLCVTLLFERE